MNKEHKYKDKDKYKDNDKDKDKDTKKITETLTVCYIIGILMTRPVQPSTAHYSCETLVSRTFHQSSLASPQK